MVKEETYFNSLNSYEKEEYIKRLETYAKENNVPIIMRDGFDALASVVRLKNAKKILEIGTAIGYCASRLAFLDEDIKVVTIERDEKMHAEAVKNIKDACLENRVQIIFSDALEVDENTLDKDFDLIFIDAAKSQYTKFFLKYEKNLKKGGVIFSDNLLFHGLVENATGEESRNLKQMLAKIKAFNEWLSKNEDYVTTFLRIGDGVAISIKK